MVECRASDLKTRLELVTALEEAIRRPGSAAYSDELGKMLEDDANYLADIYHKMIFDASGSLIRENIAVAVELDEWLYYQTKSEKNDSTELSKLRQEILSDEFYKKVRPLVAEQATYRETGGFEEAKRRREKDQRDIVSSISDENFAEWTDALEILAKQKGVIDDWKLIDLNRFFERLSATKPEFSDKILGEALKYKSAVLQFSAFFLMGFQNGNHFDLWDKYVGLFIKQKSVYLTAGIFFSLPKSDSEKQKRKLRSSELNLLEEAIYKKGRFRFLIKAKEADNGGYLHGSLMSVACSYFHQNPSMMERLIKQEFEGNLEYRYIFYNTLQFSLLASDSDIKISKVSAHFRLYLLKKIVEAPELDWNLQELLIALCKESPNLILDVFGKRIAHLVTFQKDDKSRGSQRLCKQKEYEAVPFHFNPDLQKIIIENKELPKTIMKWVKKMTLGWSPYNWEISRFLESAGVDMQAIFSRIVKKSDDKALLRIASTLDGTDGSDLDLCMEIIGRTDDKKIVRKIGSIIYSTGVVSGEYGIADAYKKKAELLQQYKKSKNRRKRSFAIDMIRRLEKDEIEERKSADEDRQLRKIQFEG